MKRYIKSTEVTETLLSKYLQSNSQQLAEIMLSGRLACVVMDPTPENEVNAIFFGWDGESPVFAMEDDIRSILALMLEKTNVTWADWLMDDTEHHILAIIKDGFLMINHHDDQFTIEQHDNEHN